MHLTFIETILGCLHVVTVSLRLLSVFFLVTLQDEYFSRLINRNRDKREAGEGMTVYIGYNVKCNRN